MVDLPTVAVLSVALATRRSPIRVFAPWYLEFRHVVTL